MKKLGLLALAIVLALGVLGAGYALWSQQLTITGTVTTGEVKIGIRDTGTNDPPPGWYEGANVYDGSLDPTSLIGVDRKNIASCESIDGEYKFTKDGVDYYHGITYKIENAYPCYECVGGFDVTNAGIPVKLKSINIDPPSMAEVTYTFAGLQEMQQIHTCETVSGTVTFHVEQEAVENSNYTFTITLDFWQWNEA
jgi:predicted ribosomally synthesized peptide with SipW-like signal peptide